MSESSADGRSSKDRKREKCRPARRVGRRRPGDRKHCEAKKAQRQPRKRNDGQDSMQAANPAVIGLYDGRLETQEKQSKYAGTEEKPAYCPDSAGGSRPAG